MRYAGLSRRTRNLMLLLMAAAIVMGACKTFPYLFADSPAKITVPVLEPE
jgi:hypothetical protein